MSADFWASIRCITCENRRRIRIGSHWVACPRCCRVSIDDARNAARGQLRECARKWLKGETGDENLRMAIRGVTRNGGTIYDVKKLTGISLDRLRKLENGQVTLWQP